MFVFEIYCCRAWTIQKEAVVGLVQLDSSEQQHSHDDCMCYGGAAQTA